MVPKLIVMLTYHDVTVANSKEIFLGAKDAPADYWGFKNVGLPEDEMTDLVDCMHTHGKTVFLESLAHTEEDSLASVEQAARCGFDMLLGAHFFPSVIDAAQKYDLKYLPFVGKRSEGKLYGSIEEIVNDAMSIAKTPVYGINISGYRYMDGDPEVLISSVVKSINKPVSCAGSVNDFHRMDSLKSAGVWAFTIGGAFFEKTFGETFAEQIAVVDAYLKG